MRRRAQAAAASTPVASSLASHARAAAPARSLRHRRLCGAPRALGPRRATRRAHTRMHAHSAPSVVTVVVGFVCARRLRARHTAACLPSPAPPPRPARRVPPRLHQCSSGRVVFWVSRRAAATSQLLPRPAHAPAWAAACSGRAASAGDAPRAPRRAYRCRTGRAPPSARSQAHAGARGAHDCSAAAQPALRARLRECALGRSAAARPRSRRPLCALGDARRGTARKQREQCDRATPPALDAACAASPPRCHQFRCPGSASKRAARAKRQRRQRCSQPRVHTRGRAA